MCLFCKHLKELRKSDFEAQQKLIAKWRKNNQKADEYLRQSVALLLLTCPHDFESMEVVLKHCLKVLKFVQPDVV